MDSSTTANSSSNLHRFVVIAQHLHDYKQGSSSSSSSDLILQKQIQKTEGKVVAQVGSKESATPTLGQRFRTTKAAVLVCLFEGDNGDLRVILTKRASKLSTHSGEVSLPGGKDDEETALREAKEEIGVDPSLVDVVNVLEPFLSKHLLRVVPFIGILRDRNAFRPTPNCTEVEEIFDAPLEMCLKDENRTAEERESTGEKDLLHSFHYEYESKKCLIWGLTAAILIRAASVALRKPPAFLEGKRKF